MQKSLLLVVLSALGLPLYSSAQHNSQVQRKKIIVDNFEQYTRGETANGWSFIDRDGTLTPAEKALEEGERFEVMREKGNHFLRIETRKESLRLSQVNGRSFEWNVKEYPILSWRWRAHHLPEGANEKKENDSGAAIYVTFGKDALGRPRSIKYTYSSSLPVGTRVDYGTLTVIVASSADILPTGNWYSLQRDLVKDYKKVFGGGLFRSSSPPDEPLSITLWSDSDSTQDSAIVEFDDIELWAPRR